MEHIHNFKPYYDGLYCQGCGDVKQNPIQPPLPPLAQPSNTNFHLYFLQN